MTLLLILVPAITLKDGAKLVHRSTDVGRYHHIIDPSAYYPSDSGIRSATIVSDNGLLRDAFSTACFVLGLEKALELAKNK